MISFHLVVLSIQSARSLTLTEPDARHFRTKGYFHQWEDYALFSLFVFFTYANLHHFVAPTHFYFHSLECFARICVSGLILDPEVPFTFIFTSPFKPSEDEPIRSALTPGPAHTPSVNRSGMARTHTLGHRLHQIKNNFFKPFALHHKSTVDTTNGGTAATTRTRSGTETRTPMMEKAMAKAQRTHDIVRDPKSNFLTNFLRSDKPDTVSLPFKLVIEQSHQSTRRNMPYLRQSWNRIDFLSILCFWISFALATGGVEKGSIHVGIFRAISVLKVSRLLAVTSGTTVSILQFRVAFTLNGI